VALPLSACKSAPAPAEKVAFESVCEARFDPVMKQGLDETKRIAVERYLDFEKSFMTLCTDTCQLALYPDAAKAGSPLTVSLTVGTDEARMEALRRGRPRRGALGKRLRAGCARATASPSTSPLADVRHRRPRLARLERLAAL
jgi:hypothetical protein